MKIQLGDEVKDKVSGFRGIAIARTQWMTGCDRINVQPKIDKDGKLPEVQSFDEGMLDIVKTKKEKKEKTDKGGPRMTVINNKF